MTFATQRVQNEMRYAIDAGTVPPPPRRRGRLFWIAILGVVAGLVAFTSHGSRAPSNPWVDPDSPSVSPAMVPSGIEPTRKRSFTQKDAGEAAIASPAPIVPSADPTVTPFATASATKPAEPLVTGSVADLIEEAPARLDRSRDQRPRIRPILRQARQSAGGLERGDRRQSAETQRAPQSASSARRATAAYTALPAAAPVARTDRPKPRHAEARIAPERPRATLPTKTVSVCLYFVVCF
jgi:hypothetical protein